MTSSRFRNSPRALPRCQAPSGWTIVEAEP